MQVQSLGREDSIEQTMATHCNILAWEIPWTLEPGRLISFLGIIIEPCAPSPFISPVKLSAFGLCHYPPATYKHVYKTWDR